ncbi:hypothetical protein C5S36_13435 [Candidatus Methanophagaceae archaeon]|nr:hypothetical protein C5S36_13435 [Methanophagales archaeon]
MTGHEVPGGQPIITVLRLSITSFTAFITGTGIGTPMSSSPKAKSISHVFAVFTTPSPRFCSVIAPRGHTIVQPPQPWQSCGKLCTSPFIPALGRTTNNALYSQNLEPSPQSIPPILSHLWDMRPHKLYNCDHYNYNTSHNLFLLFHLPF